LVLPFASQILKATNLREKIITDLHNAKIKLSPEEYLSLRLLLMVLGGGIAYILLQRLDLLIFIGGIGGFILPELWLKNRISQRKLAIASVLPETVDLLGLCVEAGLDFTAAIGWLVEKNLCVNPLIEELGVVLEEIKWGKPRMQALKDMAKRLNISEVSSFVQTLVQAERMGTPVSEAFMIISEDTRLMRFREKERLALKAPIKILIPLIFCILPVIGIIIGGPIFLKFFQEQLFTLPK
jgi:tight adherence protein C